MQQQYLVTVGDDPSALHGLRFFASFLRAREDVGCTLLYVVPQAEADPQPGDSGQDARLARQRAEQLRVKGEEALARASAYLVEQGFDPAAVSTSLRLRQFGTARDIIQEALRGQYDALVLGRRGLSRLDELLVDSVSKAVLTTPVDIPIWICPRTERVHDHVMLCVDASRESLRAADHVGYVLAGQPQHAVHLLHVADPLAGGEGEEYLEAAREAVLVNGVEPERITQETRHGADPGRVILEHAVARRAGVIAMGRTGGDLPALQRLFMGSVSMRVLRGMNETSLWVCH